MQGDEFGGTKSAQTTTRLSLAELGLSASLYNVKEKINEEDNESDRQSAGEPNHSERDRFGEKSYCSESESESGTSLSEGSFDEDDIECHDLRQAGEYGRALLELLEKESRRARILSDLLEREQRLNSELLNKQEDISRLRRRATYQQTHLDQLEDQAQELEQSLQSQREAAMEEKRRRRALEQEVENLRKLIAEKDHSRFDSPLQQGALSDENEETENNAKQQDVLSEVQSQEPGDEEPDEVRDLARAAASVGRQMSLLLSSSDDPRLSLAREQKNGSPQTSRRQSGNQEVSPSDFQRPSNGAASSLSFEESLTCFSNDSLIGDASEFEEIRQMYEEERERRQLLQKEIESLLEECEIQRQRAERRRTRGSRNFKGIKAQNELVQSNHEQKQQFGCTWSLTSNHSVAADFAVQSLREELGYRRANRRATICGKVNSAMLIQKFAQEDAKKKPPPLMILPPVKEAPATPMPVPRMPMVTGIKKRRMGVGTMPSEDNSYMIYVIQVENDHRGWRMVETRFSYFPIVHHWLLEHYRGGMLSVEPAQIPRNFSWFWYGSSLDPQNVKERRNWLHLNLLAVQQQQEELVDVLLDFIGSLNTSA